MTFVGLKRESQPLKSGESGEPLWVTVQTSGQNYVISDIHRFDDVSKLRKKIKSATGVSVREQRLYLGGVPLQDHTTLGSYSITSGALIHLSRRIAAKKPVIYLYPPTSITAKVQVSLVPQWELSVVYPRPIKGSFTGGRSSQIAEWEVVAHPNGTMTMEGSSVEVAYLFWEAELKPTFGLLDSPPASRPPSPLPSAQSGVLKPRAGFIPGATRCSPQDSVVMSAQDVTPYLEKALLALGLHTEARTSFITYWLPSFLEHEYIALRFIPQVDYEASAPLLVEPKPDVVTRVLMLFQGIMAAQLAEWEEARERSLADVSMWKGIVGTEDARQRDESLFRVLEWGGME
ncbi:hypothetical protein FS837_007912, partial [Tulasnella sp. UAMH 9824]